MTSQEEDITQKFDQINRIELWYQKGWITFEMKHIMLAGAVFGEKFGNLLLEVYREEQKIKQDFHTEYSNLN